MSENNPLLEVASDPESLPAFDRIRPEHVRPAMEALIGELRELHEARMAQGAPWSWDDTIAPLERAEHALDRAWSPVSHLNSVVSEPELREAHNAVLPMLTELETELAQDPRLYGAMEAIRGEDDQLDDARRACLDQALRDLRLSGVHLAAADKARFKEIQQELSLVQTRFEENLMDSSDAFSYHLEDRDRLAGLPEHVIQGAAARAVDSGVEGWVLGLDFPTYHAVMTLSEDRELRETFCRAWFTRASELGDPTHDNSELMQRILDLRHESATLLSFEDFTEYSLATKMARDPEQVLGFLEDLVQRSVDRARDELAAVERFAAEHGAGLPLTAWDIPFWSERLKLERFHLSDDLLRPWFPLEKVLSGLFDITGRLYGVSIEEQPAPAPWHPDVRFFHISDAGGHRGSFYLDLYARRAKRGGAWMDECAARIRSGELSTDPVAYLVCNFTPPDQEGRTLLTHDEVLTLFHEFGHGLHHLMTRVDVPSVAGINGVPWDAVELPSQFMENFAWERGGLDLIAEHHETGEAMPEELFQRLRGSRSYNAAMQMVRQLEFALFDFRLHREHRPERGSDVQGLLSEVRERVSVVPTPDFNRFAHSFSHIFGGGYAAGYYSYKWAEVLSADAFSAFEEAGLFDRATGERFRDTVLASGGTRDALALFVDFRGREPSVEPLLRHSGLAA